MPGAAQQIRSVGTCVRRRLGQFYGALRCSTNTVTCFRCEGAHKLRPVPLRCSRNTVSRRRRPTPISPAPHLAPATLPNLTGLARQLLMLRIFSWSRHLYFITHPTDWSSAALNGARASSLPLHHPLGIALYIGTCVTTVLRCLWTWVIVCPALETLRHASRCRCRYRLSSASRPYTG